MIITYSSAAMFGLCPRKYKYRHVDGLVGSREGAALTFGKTIHAGLEAYHSAESRERGLPAAMEATDCACKESGCDAEMAAAMIVGYHDRWMLDDLRAIATELEFAVDLGEGVTFAGKVDGVVIAGEEAWLIEHKTTSSIGGAYISRLALDAQSNLYQLVQLQIDRPIVGAIYNVLRKPGIKQNKRESLDAYRIRLGEKCADDDMYLRIRLPRANHVVDGAVADLRAVSTEIDRCHQIGEWRRTTGACTSWGRACEYLPICSAKYPDAVAATYDRKPPHSELSTQDLA